MNDFQFLIYLFLIGNFVIFLLITLFKKVWYFWDVKNCVDVQVFYIGDNSIKRKYINCRKSKRNIESGFETYELTPFPFGKDTFQFNTKYSILRTDGKDTIDYVDINGKKMPIMPNYEVEFNYKDGKVSQELKTAITNSSLKTITAQETDAIVEFTLRNNIQKIKSASQKTKGLSGFQMLAIGISVLLIIGLIAYFMLRKKTGG